MSIIDALGQHAEDARRPRPNHPRGFEPGVKFNPDTQMPAEVTLTLSEMPADEKRYREEIARVTGLTIPTERAVSLSQVRYWGNPESPMIYCRFTIEDRPEDGGPDAVEILRDLRKTPRPRIRTKLDGEGALVLSWNDWQLGKAIGGGTTATVARLDAAFDAAHDRTKELRRLGRPLGELVILGGGDMVEGCTIFPHQPFELDSDRRTQIRNTVALILDGLDRLAPLYDRVKVLVVGGNHGENRVDGHRVNRSDNDDCAVFEHAALAAQRDSRLGHVDFVIAQDEPAKTLEVAGYVLGTTHGHVYGKGMSGSQEQKAYKWFTQQAGGRQPIGDADVFVTHHYHHFAARDWGATQWVQTPAMDGGSPFFTDFSGQASEPGMLSFTMSPGHRFRDLQIL